MSSRQAATCWFLLPSGTVTLHLTIWCALQFCISTLHLVLYDNNPRRSVVRYLSNRLLNKKDEKSENYYSLDEGAESVVAKPRGGKTPTFRRRTVQPEHMVLQSDCQKLFDAVTYRVTCSFASPRTLLIPWRQISSRRGSPPSPRRRRGRTTSASTIQSS